ncbi:lipoate--protein ligase family protein [Acidihalobacter ferrooxydans]|uniref:Lipoate--protein ligase n=1 Tax=Acidihalobacter ferrooxydans TaxID=1765967 RepID=A0A1P8UHR5_9GAMM|nr:biotin/lipoate A/B protein ligase family protein [Acidihalobacter ferrooxydans]APZ43362.1 lipoate--protein ligase [Acidihalobacter ferrooxydans]
MNSQAGCPWRVIDTGVLRAAENFALNQALLDCHQSGLSPHTLRFLRFSPSALIGFHQHVEQELRLDYCHEHGIEIQRRVTGGGALYFDETVLGWELYLDKHIFGTAQMGAVAERICTAVADGISRLGVDARFRPRNDIEIAGRKVSGTGGAFDGDSILYQGTLLLDFDVERMLRVLRIPAEKLSDKAISSARERVVSLRELLGETPAIKGVQRHIMDAIGESFGIKFERAGELNASEQVAYVNALAEIDTTEWVYQHNRPLADAPMLESVLRTKGGVLRACVAIDQPRQHLKQVWLTGDFFVKPRRVVLDLEAALKDTPLAKLESNVDAFFAKTESEMLLLEPRDFATAIRQAVASADSACEVSS